MQNLYQTMDGPSSAKTTDVAPFYDGLVNLVSMALTPSPSGSPSESSPNVGVTQHRHTMNILNELLSDDLLSPIPPTTAITTARVGPAINNTSITQNNFGFASILENDMLEPTPLSPQFTNNTSRTTQPTPLMLNTASAAETDSGALDRLIAQELELKTATKPKRVLAETKSCPSSAPVSNKRLCRREPDVTDENQMPPRFRDYQETGWMDQFNELKAFRKAHGHCLVPHTFQENPVLARWVKRQRYQYKLKKENKGNSTMTDTRIQMLESVGFVWDSHAVVWGERLEELKEFQAEFGHCIVPANYMKYPSLATWVKCQRRQNKLFWNGERSTMTQERFRALCDLGFTWELRRSKKKAKA